MSEETERQMLETLREIRDAQREALRLMEAQLEASGVRVEESIGLQRLAMRRQRAVTFFALPGIIACIAAIAYLVFRYF
jgi:hypothetical protein